jgi:hypothetical protein
MTTGELIQVILMVLLVVVTSIYAWRTFAISKATRKQADASAEMTKEVKDKKYSESLPLLVPTIPPILPSDELPYESVQSGVGMRVFWCNIGKGVAINSQVSFETIPTSTGKANFFPPRYLGTVEVGGKKEVDYGKILNDGQLHDISDGYQPRLEVEYRDIYQRKITTVQEFHIGEQNGNKKVSLGELYFTINGRRLGEEVAQRD